MTEHTAKILDEWYSALETKKLFDIRLSRSQRNHTIQKDIDEMQDKIKENLDAIERINNILEDRGEI